MEIKRYYIPKLPRNKYKYSGSGGGTYTGGDSVSYVYNNTKTVDIYDGLDSFSTKKALSANQGMVLKGLIDEHITVTDDLQEQIIANLQYSKDNFLSKKDEDTAEQLIHFLQGIDAQGISTLEDITLLGELVSSNFVKDSNGFGIYQDDEGKYHLDIDNLSVRGKFTTEVLEVKESTHIGGKIYSTKAGMICSKVEEYDTYYRCYFNTTDADGRIINNQFAVNDQAFMQTFNLAQQTGGKIGNRRFWRLVDAIGENYIDLSKTDYESGSDAPLAGDSIVQLGNRSDSTRQGALILEPLSMKVYKGIKSYVLPTPFIDLNPEKSVIEAQLINVATGEDINDTINSINNRIAQVKEQSDKCFTIWMDAYTPTLENLPASDWTTDSLKNEHLQDIFYNTSKEAGSGGRAYRFEIKNGVYSWVEITDKDTIAALEQAKQAEDLADSKRRVFVEQPTVNSVYDVGDIWVNANYNDGTTIYKNDELVCITAKTAGMAFSISHWKATSTATTAYLENLGNQITLAVTDSNEGIEAAKALAQKGITDAASAATKAQQGINDAATALAKANSAYNLADSANATATENTTVIQQNKDSITALANKISFDSSGNVTNINKSGLVTTADFNSLLSDKVSFDSSGNVTNISTSGLVTTSNFANMFSEQTTKDGLVKRADIATFITEDEAGELISNTTISADKIDFIGKTTINGNFVVDKNGNVTMNNATVNGTINASAGTIGGLTINGNSLTNEGFDNDAYIVMRNDANNIFCGIGGNVLPASTGTRAVARFENEYDGGSESDIYNSTLGANYAAILSAKNARYNIALALNGGFIQGAALRTDLITSSKTLSRATNVAVTLNNSATLTINLPTMYDYDDGHILWVCNQGSYGGTLNAGTNIEDGTTRNSYISSVDDGNKILAYITKGVSRMMFIYCHYLTTTIAGNTYSGCWMRII